MKRNIYRSCFLLLLLCFVSSCGNAVHSENYMFLKDLVLIFEKCNEALGNYPAGTDDVKVLHSKASRQVDLFQQGERIITPHMNSSNPQVHSAAVSFHVSLDLLMRSSEAVVNLIGDRSADTEKVNARLSSIAQSRSEAWLSLYRSSLYLAPLVAAPSSVSSKKTKISFRVSDREKRDLAERTGALLTKIEGHAADFSLGQGPYLVQVVALLEALLSARTYQDLVKMEGEN